MRLKVTATLAVAFVSLSLAAGGQLNLTNGTDIDMTGSGGSTIIFPDGSVLSTATGQGADGADGADGAQGPQGDQGPPGAPGADAPVAEHVLIVSPSGGDFTSVADALASITSPSSSNRWLVKVGPGVYTETDLCVVQPYVHLQGSGENVSVITSTRTGSSPNTTAATVDLQDLGRISDITIENKGTGVFGIGVYSNGATWQTVLEDSSVVVDGAGGTGHYAVYLYDSEATIKSSNLSATGASGFGSAVNAALGCINATGGFPQPMILDSILLGGTSVSDPTGTGFGLQLSSASPEIRGCIIEGGHRAVSQTVAGTTRIRNSTVQVSSTNQAFMVETTGSGAVLFYNTGVFYVGNKETGAGNGASCVQCYLANNTEADANCD